MKQNVVAFSADLIAKSASFGAHGRLGRGGGGFIMVRGKSKGITIWTREVYQFSHNAAWWNFQIKNIDTFIYSVSHFSVLMAHCKKMGSSGDMSPKPWPPPPLGRGVRLRVNFFSPFFINIFLNLHILRLGVTKKLLWILFYILSEKVDMSPKKSSFLTPYLML